MTMTRSQIERLGVRLVRSDPPAAEDLAALHELLLGYGDALADAVATVQGALGLTPSSRVKTTETILEKLERYGGSWLKTLQDLAGMRIVGSFDRRGQDALVARLIELFSDPTRVPKVVDRRQAPSHGYRAVHVLVLVRAVPVEIQVRTELQHEWADLFEKLADMIGRGIRYGEPPDHSLSVAQREHLPEIGQMRYQLRYELKGLAVELAQTVAEMIDVYEITEVLDPTDPELFSDRARVDAALADLTDKLHQLARWEKRGTARL